MSDSVRPHRQQPTRLPRPWDSPSKSTGVDCHFLLQCMKVKSERKSLSRVRLLATPWTAAHQAPPSMGFSRQEYWSGVSLPSPICLLEYYKKLSCSFLNKNTWYAETSGLIWQIKFRHFTLCLSKSPMKCQKEENRTTKIGGKKAD